MDATLEELISHVAILYGNKPELIQLTPILKNLTQLMKMDRHRSEITDNHWKVLTNLACTSAQILSKEMWTSYELEFLAEFFRFLRNACAGSKINQHRIINTTEVYNCCGKALITFLHKECEEERTVLKCCLQLFGNLVCLGNDSKSIAWHLFFKANVFQHLFQTGDPKLIEFAMMILYNCMYDDAFLEVVNTPEGHEILVSLTTCLCSSIIDWGILFLELMMKQENFMDKCYSIFPTRNKLLVLDVVTEKLENAQQNSSCFVSLACVDCVKKLFVEYALNIVQICGETQAPDLKSLEIVKMLSLLCTASVVDTYNCVFKTSKDLLEVSIDTLKAVHLLGKKSCNAFSCISNLRETENISKEDIECHPSYGFKKNLIRLIGNLCYNSKENQDLVRKLDGIPLLLDCCNLDARNPFIMQWCILAIRNLMEKNPENQGVLSTMSVTGDLVDSALLKELGFTVHNDNGKFVLKSINS